MRTAAALLNSVAGMVLLAFLNTLWQSAAVAALAWLAMRFLPRVSAATRLVVWWVVLGCVVALPLAQMAVRIPASKRAAVAGPVAAALETLTQRAPESPSPSDQPSAGTLTAEPVNAAIQATGATFTWHPPAFPFEFRAGRWPAVLAALWLMLACWHAIRIARSYLYLRGVKRRSREASKETHEQFARLLLDCRVDRPTRLLVSSEIVSPMAVGFLHPAVILPEALLADLGSDELEHVLLHETAHLARHDDWLNLVARIAAGVLALHPVAVWVFHRIEIEREVACDDWVVASTGEARPYAKSLARLFELCLARKQVVLASGMAGRASHLGERIEMLLRGGRDFAAQASTLQVTLLAAILLLAGVAGARAERWVAFSDRASVLSIRQSRLLPAITRRLDAYTFTRGVAWPLRRFQALAAGRRPVARLVVDRREQRPRSFLADLAEAGYKDLSVDEIVDLKIQGVTGEFVRGISEAGWGKLTPRQLIALKIRGVSPRYVRDMKRAGLRDLSLAEVIELRIHGVSPEELQEIHSLGFGPYTSK